jgi:glyoxylase-like metal-dependent hydrolase (beta-lactamase superfamily II)
LHLDDINFETEEVEIKLDIHEPLQFAEDLLIIPVPGHTKGHTVLLYKNKFLFTGDHLAWSSRRQKLVAFKDFCWYSWDKVIESMEKLTQYQFNWVLPGHGRRFHSDYQTMKQELSDCLQWMKNN